MELRADGYETTEFDVLISPEQTVTFAGDMKKTSRRLGGGGRAGSHSLLRLVAAISGIYDAAIGLFLLLAADRFAALFGVAPPQPPIFADLNGLFLVAVGIGYYFPYRDPRGARWYMWVMGPLLKGAGAVAFLLDYFVRGHSPAALSAVRGERRHARGADAARAAAPRELRNSTTPNAQVTPNAPTPKTRQGTDETPRKKGKL